MINQNSFGNDTNTLYIVPTPIGNLEDITIRALRILNEVTTIFCEDTRVTRKLLSHYEIKSHLHSYHEHNKEYAITKVLKSLVEGDIALVSDAGMPAISDPGYNLISKAKDEGFNVVVLPGASAFLLGLVFSNFNSEEFKYVGFLPKQPTKRTQKLHNLVHGECSSVFYESPHKILNTLEELNEISGSVKLTLGRELTKKFEQYIEGTPLEILNYLKVKGVKGEFIVVVHPEVEKNSSLSIYEQVLEQEQLGIDRKKAIKDVANRNNIMKNEVYQLFVEEKND